MDKFITKDNIIIVVVCFCMITGFMVQSNFFATKLDIANTNIRILELKEEMKNYTDNRDNELIKSIDNKLEKIETKLDRIRN